DAGMNDLIRPALYEAWHEIIPVVEAGNDAHRETVDIVGPVCESSDVFARARSLPGATPGTLFAIRSAPPYAPVMSSSYNSKPLIPEVVVKGSQFAVIRPRPSYDAMLGADVLPKWK